MLTRYFLVMVVVTAISAPLFANSSIEMSPDEGFLMAQGLKKPGCACAAKGDLP